jgi:hypothetical protein
MSALADAGAHVATVPSDVVQLLRAL